MNAKELIARRAALELNDGDIVNLGIGLPTLLANYWPKGVSITLQSENGFLGLGPATEPDPMQVNAGNQPCGMIPGAATFDSAFSFSLIRGGHVDACVLGGLQVAENGALANWMTPDKMIPVMGGAMDLVVGSKKVGVAMEHCTKEGAPKILHACTLPLAAVRCVSTIVTELALFKVINETLVLKELAPGVDLDAVQAKIETALTIAPDLKTMPIPPFDTKEQIMIARVSKGLTWFVSRYLPDPLVFAIFLTIVTFFVGMASMGTTAGILVQFPFYAGIQLMMDHSGLGGLITQFFINISNAQTFPILTFFSSAIVNFAVPSDGGHWVVQGPFVMPAAQALGADLGKAAMAIAYGEAWMNMAQPFWALPALAVAGLGVRDIMGYCVTALLFSCLIFVAGLAFF